MLLQKNVKQMVKGLRFMQKKFTKMHQEVDADKTQLNALEKFYAHLHLNRHYDEITRDGRAAVHNIRNEVYAAIEFLDKNHSTQVTKAKRLRTIEKMKKCLQDVEKLDRLLDNKVNVRITLSEEAKELQRKMVTNEQVKQMVAEGLITESVANDLAEYPDIATLFRDKFKIKKEEKQDDTIKE